VRFSFKQLTYLYDTNTNIFGSNLWYLLVLWSSCVEFRISALTSDVFGLFTNFMLLALANESIFGKSVNMFCASTCAEYFVQRMLAIKSKM